MRGAVPAGGLEHLQAAGRVGVVAGERVGDGPRHGRQRREVHDRVRARQRLVEQPGVEDAALEQLDVEAGQVLRVTRREVVDDDHLVAVRHQPAGQVRPDEARASGHHDPHVSPS